ncbi:MAG: glycosyltransferase family 1 protein [Candidatus Omnitrophica bacterium]|nr:glycosyltransferase family 1 protein [Candidatus Omnitrophota bacterium]
MKIGIDARFLQEPRRGQGQYLYYLIKELLEIDAENEYVIFYNNLKTGKFTFDKATPRLRQVWCNIPGTLLKQTWSRFRFPPVEYLIGDVDLFHNPANFCFTHYAPIPSRAKMVATFNGMADPATIWEKCDRSKLDAWFREIARTASIIIAVSEMAKKDLLRRVHLPEEKIRVIHYGVSEEFRLISDTKAFDAVLSKYSLAGKRYLLYVGAAEPNKNLDRLIDLFCAISKKAGMKDLYLALAGKIDHFYRALISKAGALGMEGKVIFTDYVSHDDLPFIYNGAEAFVLPTLNEWFGIPVLEAMACGIPVIASKKTGAIEAVGDAVILFDPLDAKEMADSIGAVLSDKDLRVSLRNKALERVKGLSWKETARRTLAVYEEIYLQKGA